MTSQIKVRSEILLFFLMGNLEDLYMGLPKFPFKVFFSFPFHDIFKLYSLSIGFNQVNSRSINSL